jgi:hypothetical protein
VKLVRSAALVAATTVAVLAPSAAQAKSWSHADATGDVFSRTGNSGAFAPAPGRATGDVVSSTIRHKRNVVLIQLRYNDLEPNSEINGHFFAIKTSKMRRDVTLVAAGSFPSGQVQMTKPSGKKVRCHVGRRIDYTANTATVIVPRSCLGKPKWVKVGMAGLSFTGFGATDTQYVDDALSSGATGAYSPRVYR